MGRWFSGSWVRAAEHGAVRFFSLLFSMASAYAIRLFFAPLDAADSGERYITWGVAIGFGGLGYIVSRGLVHRLMNKESIWAYAPICFLVELVDIACNYVLAASVVRQAWWLALVPTNQQGILTFLTYLVLSAIPLVSIFLAVVDMDLDRSKQGGHGNGKPVVRPVGQPVRAGATTSGNRNGANAAARTAASGNGGAANTAADAAAARRAQFFANRQRQDQQSGASSARTLLNDPEKEEALAGVP